VGVGVDVAIFSVSRVGIGDEESCGCCLWAGVLVGWAVGVTLAAESTKGVRDGVCVGTKLFVGGSVI